MFSFNKKICLSAGSWNTVTDCANQLNRTFATSFLLRELCRDRGHSFMRLNVMQCTTGPEGDCVIDERFGNKDLLGRMASTIVRLQRDAQFRERVIAQLAAGGQVPMCAVGQFESMPIPHDFDKEPELAFIFRRSNPAILVLEGDQRHAALKSAIDGAFSTAVAFCPWYFVDNVTEYEPFGEVTTAQMLDLFLSIVAEVLLNLPRESQDHSVPATSNLLSAMRLDCTALLTSFNSRDDAASYLSVCIEATFEVVQSRAQWAYILSDDAGSFVWHKSFGQEAPREMWQNFFMRGMTKLPFDVSAQAIFLAFSSRKHTANRGGSNNA